MLKSVGRLIIVAAPSCCGKSVFLAHLTSGAIPQIAATIGVGGVDQWRICDAMYLAGLPEEHIECLIVAYAIPTYEVTVGRQFKPSSDPRLNIVSLARETTFVTLLASSASLTYRLKERHPISIRRVLLRPRKFAESRRFMHRLLPIYQDPEAMRAVYDWWFQYTASVSNRGEWVVNADAKYKLRGRFKRMTSAPERGEWVANAHASYRIHQGSSWTEVFTRINSGQLAVSTRGLAPQAHDQT